MKPPWKYKQKNQLGKRKTALNQTMPKSRKPKPNQGRERPQRSRRSLPLNQYQNFFRQKRHWQVCSVKIYFLGPPVSLRVRSPLRISETCSGLLQNLKKGHLVKRRKMIRACVGGRNCRLRVGVCGMQQLAIMMMSYYSNLVKKHRNRNQMLLGLPVRSHTTLQERNPT